MINGNTLREGTLLKSGTYRVEKAIGNGGFGMTYRAVHVELGRTVAIKEFFISEYCVRDILDQNMSVAVEQNVPLVDNYRKKFLQEARMVAKLNNRHIIDVFDIFEENGTAYYVMEYLAGGSLEEMVKANGALPENQVKKIVSQLGGALSYIHSQRILHLDIKPSNIMINDEGDVVLIDFGISKQYDDTHSTHSTYAATFSKSYAPIEQYEKGGVRSFIPALDVYSFGATVYYLVSGTVPPTAFELLKDGVASVPGAGKELSAAIVAAMQPVQSCRLQSIDEFLSMVEGKKIAVVGKPGKAIGNPQDDSRTVIDASDRGAVGTFEVFSDGKSGKQPKNGNKSLVWGVVIVSLLALLGAGAYFFVLNSSAGKNDSSVPVNANNDALLPLFKALEGVSSNDSIAEPAVKQEPVETVVADSVVSPIPESSMEPAPDEAAPSPEKKKQPEKKKSESKETEAKKLETVVPFKDKKNAQPSKDKKEKKSAEQSQSNKDAASEGIRYARSGNYKKAIPLLEQASLNGNATAQNVLGECYQKGNGVGIDYSKAAGYYRKAANSGNAEAQYNLAVCYSRGLGVSKDMKQAYNYFQKAAGKGHARAQYEMGEFYRIGLSGVVSIDLESAKRWYEKSASQGYSPAANKLKQLESRL